jgi:hypothetical protein
MPFPELPDAATPEQKKERLSKAARELTDAHKAILDLLRLRRRYLPQSVDEAVHACIMAITRELPEMFTVEDPSTAEDRARIQQGLQVVAPIVKQAIDALRGRLDELRRLPD